MGISTPVAVLPRQLEPCYHLEKPKGEGDYSRSEATLFLSLDPLQSKKVTLRDTGQYHDLFSALSFKRAQSLEFTSVVTGMRSKVDDQVLQLC